MSPLPVSRPDDLAPPHLVEVSRAQSLDDIDALEDAWTNLAARAQSPLGKFSWMRACLASFADSDPAILALLRGSRLAAVAPLVKRRLAGVNRLFFAGSSELSEPMDFAWTESGGLEHLLAALVRSGTPLWLDRIAARSATVKTLERAYRYRAIVLKRTCAGSPYIPLDESWLEPLRHVSPRQRRNLERARRRAEQQGTLSVEIHAPDLKDLPELLNKALELDNPNRKRAKGNTRRRDPQRVMFLQQYLQASAIDGTLRICLLRIGERLAAMQLAVECGGGFWLLKVGFDRRFASCSPGMLLARETIRYAAEAGLERYEFLGESEPWTRVWTRHEHACVSLRAYPLGVCGIAALAADVSVKVARKLAPLVDKCEQRMAKFEWRAIAKRLSRACKPRTASVAREISSREASGPGHWDGAEDPVERKSRRGPTRRTPREHLPRG